MKVLNSLEFQGASFAEGAQLSEKEMLHIIGGQQGESYSGDVNIFFALSCKKG